MRERPNVVPSLDLCMGLDCGPAFDPKPPTWLDDFRGPAFDPKPPTWLDDLDWALDPRPPTRLDDLFFELPLLTLATFIH